MTQEEIHVFVMTVLLGVVGGIVALAFGASYAQTIIVGAAVAMGFNGLLFAAGRIQ